MRTLRLRKDKLQWLESDGQVIALDEKALVYISANGTGGALWRELAAGTTHVRLVERLTAEYGVDAERAAQDVDHFLAQLDAHGLLET